MREAGYFEEFKRYGRSGDATIHWVCDHNGNKVFSWGEGRNAPDLDRHEIKQALLTTIPEEKIMWQKGVTASARDEKGNIILSFVDGTTATGFKPAVGADGTWSKIRHLVRPD
jgi:2-polyprenyl-6-methoxyphenol hydroxylase-like FAD-dependent oxidoreductase